MTELGRLARDWATRFDPWTNVYGVGRTLLALATALTLIFSRATTLFRPDVGLPTCPNCVGMSKISVFCVFPKDRLELARWVAVLILLVVASGWRPRTTGLLHWWISFSLQASATTLDGGDQATAVLTFLLLPVALTDARRWHWQSAAQNAPTGQRLLLRLVALSALVVTRIQVAGIYLHAAIGKMKVPEWVDGTVLYYWFTDPSFGAPGWLRPILMPLLRNGITVSLMTWGSMTLELFLFTALVMPKRAWRPFLLLGIAFHAAIAIIQGLPSFSLAMVAALILHLRPTEEKFRLPAVFRRLPRRHEAATPEDVLVGRAMAC